MGIFSFFKKKPSEPEKTEPSRGKVSFSNIEEFIEKKAEEADEKEKKEISLINEKVKTFTSELRDKIKAVNEVDVESKEKNDRVKSAVYEGRKKYVEFLERFIENIEDAVEFGAIGKGNLEKVINDINKAFLRFNESSGKSYERATILIGKEMGNIRDALKKFSNELLELFNSEKEIISHSKKLSMIRSKIENIKDTDGKLAKADEETKSLENMINSRETEKKQTYEKLEKIKKSPEYLDNLEKEKNIQFKEKEIEKAISELRTLIDFKSLSSFFHIFEDRMNIVKLYRDNFRTEFKKDKGRRLLNLLNESKLNTEKIYDKIKQIQDWEEEIENSRKKLKKDETIPLSAEIEKADEELDNLTNEKNWAEKNKEKIKATKEEDFNSIKKALELMNLDLQE